MVQLDAGSQNDYASRSPHNSGPPFPQPKGWRP